MWSSPLFSLCVGRVGLFVIQGLRVTIISGRRTQTAGIIKTCLWRCMPTAPKVTKADASKARSVKSLKNDDNKKNIDLFTVCFGIDCFI